MMSIACDPALIACQVSRLVDINGSWSWNGFFSTIIATLIGAAFSLAGVWLTFRLQRRHRDEEVLTDSIAAALKRIADYASGMRSHQDQQDRVAEDRGDYFKRTGEAVFYPPDDLNVSMALDIARMRARGDNQRALTQFVHTYGQIGTTTDIRRRLDMLEELSAVLARWRSGVLSSAEVSTSLEQIRTP
ncbi:hypothetical protein KXS11_12595 [Plantibacter flavus]|uniref:hypothetical protein n=1 Tax=Plantibacter flavus TaxID=150123 RepID=UPI003F1922F6